MDPQRTLDDLRGYIDSKSWHQAVESLGSYYQWRLKGGFEPDRGDMRAERYVSELADKVADAT